MRTIIFSVMLGLEGSARFLATRIKMKALIRVSLADLDLLKISLRNLLKFLLRNRKLKSFLLFIN